MNTFDVFEDGWGSEAYGAGKQFGKDIKSSLGGLFDDVLGGFSGDAMAGSSAGFGASGADALPAIAESSDKTAKNTEKSNEELSYLRDIAEREAINRFTTAEIKVDMSGMSNRIENNMDIDGIISYLTENVAEALVTAGEGVYA